MEEDKMLESILMKPIVLKDTYKHEYPFFLTGGTILNLSINKNCNKIVVLCVDENDNIFSDMDIILPKVNKVLHLSLGEE